jgi:PAS domain S-box-containing protein
MALILKRSTRGWPDMTSSSAEHREKGGEAPRFAHLWEDLGLGDPALGHLVQDLADAVVIGDTTGIIVFWNATATTLFGWSEDDAVGRSLDLIIPERLRNRHWEGYRRVMETGHTDYGGRLLEVPALHRDGHTFSIAFTVTLMTRPGQQRPNAIAAVLRDDTARREELLRLRDQVAILEAAADASSGDHQLSAGK